MRIIIVGINFYPELTGIGKYTGELAASLSRLGHQVRVITAPPYYPQWQVQPGYKWWQYKKETWQEIHIYRCPIWVPRTVTGLKRVLHLFSFSLSTIPVLFAQIFWKADVVFCVAPSLMNAPLALLLARLSGAKAWLHIQDFEIDAATSLGMLKSNRLITKAALWLEHSIIASFNCVSTISNRMMNRLKEKGVPKEKQFLFPNWVDTDLIFPLNLSQNEKRKILNLSRNKTIVLYAGNMGKKQGLEILIKTAERVLTLNSNILFVLCGDGATKGELEKSAKGLHNILFLPLQPVDKLNSLLNLADIHILPQRAKAEDLVMPSKLSGMLASGKAVIVSANPSTELADIMEPLGVVVRPEDLSSLTNAIILLADDSVLRKMYGQKGLEWVTTHWSKELVLKNFYEYLVRFVKM